MEKYDKAAALRRNTIERLRLDMVEAANQHRPAQLFMIDEPETKQQPALFIRMAGNVGVWKGGC